MGVEGGKLELAFHRPLGSEIIMGSAGGTMRELSCSLPADGLRGDRGGWWWGAPVLFSHSWWGTASFQSVAQHVDWRKLGKACTALMATVCLRLSNGGFWLGILCICWEGSEGCFCLISDWAGRWGKQSAWCSMRGQGEWEAHVFSWARLQITLEQKAGPLRLSIWGQQNLRLGGPCLAAVQVRNFKLHKDAEYSDSPIILKKFGPCY